MVVKKQIQGISYMLLKMSELVNSLAKQLQGDTSDLELDTVYQEVFVKSLCVY